MLKTRLIDLFAILTRFLAVHLHFTLINSDKGLLSGAPIGLFAKRILRQFAQDRRSERILYEANSRWEWVGNLINFYEALEILSPLLSS